VATITVVSGGKQVGTVGTTLPLPITVKAKNSSGVIVVGAPITFADSGLNGTFSPNPAITGSNGQASTTFTLPTSAKTMTVTATDSPATVNITEQSVAGPATALTIVQGNNQSAHPNTIFAKKLIVLLADKYGNGISGVTVTFTDNSAGGTFSTTMPVTTSNGQASVSYTAGPNTGTVTINASTSTLGPAIFTETVK
jgi:Fe-S cluster assembly iron-binding protein IscA